MKMLIYLTFPGLEIPNLNLFSDISSFQVVNKFESVVKVYREV